MRLNHEIVDHLAAFGALKTERKARPLMRRLPKPIFRKEGQGEAQNRLILIQPKFG
ncbi:MAG: hypothetical protein AAF723_10290 [Pseudomonadota bacterium]